MTDICATDPEFIRLISSRSGRNVQYENLPRFPSISTNKTILQERTREVPRILWQRSEDIPQSERSFKDYRTILRLAKEEV